jgi:MFS transporter, SP family, sugar:H+ symporter
MTNDKNESVVGKVNSTRNRFYVFAISAVAALRGFLFGFDSGTINGMVEALTGPFILPTSVPGSTSPPFCWDAQSERFLPETLADKFGRRSENKLAISARPIQRAATNQMFCAMTLTLSPAFRAGSGSP